VKNNLLIFVLFIKHHRCLLVALYCW